MSGRQQMMLWIDGVGAYLLCCEERVTVGGPSSTGKKADLALLANLSSRHATFVRSGEHYFLEAHGRVGVNDRPVEEKTDLSDGYEIQLGDGVRLGFRLPSALSATARLDFLSGHRPQRHIDGMILLETNCLLGPGSDQHIRCPDWPETVVLFRQEGQLWCKSRTNLFLAGNRLEGAAPLQPGSIVVGSDLRFHLEAVDA